MYNYGECTNEGCACVRCNCCLWLVIGIIGALLLFTVGLILGAVFAETIITALAAIIVLAVVLFIMLATMIIIAICRRCRCC